MTIDQIHHKGQKLNLFKQIIIDYTKIISWQHTT